MTILFLDTVTISDSSYRVVMKSSPVGQDRNSINRVQYFWVFVQAQKKSTIESSFLTVCGVSNL